MKEACSARLVMSRKFAEYIGIMRMLASVTCIFLLFSVSVLAQEPNSSRGQGYFLFATGGGNVGTAPDIHIAVGGEALVYRGLGIGVEVGPVSPLKTSPGGFFEDVVGLGSANLSYHFLPSTIDRKFEPFVTAGYSLFFRAGTFSGYNVGGGTNVWLGKNTALRLEGRVHSTPNYHFAGFEVGVTFR